jgi:amino acid transporter
LYLWCYVFWYKKRRDVCQLEIDHSKLERTYTLFDLICVGIGGTVGSGVFVLTGLIAREYTGPGVVFSWLIAGFGCCFSAMSYAELSCRIPSAGSSYAYVYVGLGELPAVIAAWCLSLEYGISGAAVARSWGDKMNSYIESCYPGNNPFDMGNEVNIFAGILQISVVMILLAGVDIGKITVNTFTVMKMILVSFMIVGGIMLFNPKNLEVGWAPMGGAGILRGATSCFFGYVGYDEVCCLAAEAKDPNRTLPRAVFGTIFIVTIFYCLASLSLVGMQDYREINIDSGFSEAFKSHGWITAQNIVAVGEIVTLPCVVLVSFLAQPRLQYAMADDGLLPKIFIEVNNKGNLIKGILISGFICTLIALFIPFKYLDDMISAGVLISFNLTNCSLIIIRKNDASKPYKCIFIIIIFNIISIILNYIITNLSFNSNLYNYIVDPLMISQFILIGILSSVLIYLSYILYSKFPENEDLDSISQFRVPFIPFIPLFGIVINYLLLAQLSYNGVLMICGYFGLACVFYFSYGIHYSKGNSTRWKEMISTDVNNALWIEKLSDSDSM